MKLHYTGAVYELTQKNMNHLIQQLEETRREVEALSKRYIELSDNYLADKDILKHNQLIYELERAKEELQSFYRMSSTGVWIKTEEYKKMMDERDEMRSLIQELKEIVDE